jgi:GGDEF domain-containing protein
MPPQIFNIEIVMLSDVHHGADKRYCESILCWVGHLSNEDWPLDFQHFSSFDQLKSSGLKPALIVLSLPEDQQDKQLDAIRKDDELSLCLLLVIKESKLSGYLSNGMLTQNVTTQLDTFLEKSSLVKLDYQDNLAFKLLCYMWLHSDSILEPMRQPQSSRLYVYPLLQAWGIAPEDCFSWLNGIRQNNWIETDHLVNRIRLCPDCHCGHLNYIDICPSCKNIDIGNRSSLHCFNCGHVGAKDDFKKLTSLQCPNCLQHLRHIGVDYDRPIENQHCNNCEHIFVEAQVEAQCLQCGQAHAIDALHVRNVYGFKLTSQGRILAIQGKKHTLFSLSAGEQMSLQQLLWLIDWQNKLAKRHKHTHTLLCIQLINFNQFLQSEGEAKALMQLDAFQDRLRSIVRVTDACTNYTDNGLLILLPMTNTKQLQSIYSKLLNVKEYQDKSNIEFTVKAISLPADIGDNVEDWLTDQILTTKSITI